MNMHGQGRTGMLVVVGALMTGMLAGITALHAQSAPEVAPPMNALSVEPRVPRLGITPCVVELFRDLRLSSSAEPDPERGFEFPYTPPNGCAGPWAKVILSVDLTGEGTTSVANFTISLGDARNDTYWSTELMVGGAQMNDRQLRWRVERDVTDYAALLRDARPGYALQTDYYFRDACGCSAATMSGRLIFYPATAMQPAASVPDAIYPVNSRPGGGTFYTLSLPRNIERAYVDVFAQATYATSSCVPTAAATAYPVLTQTPIAMGDVYNIEEQFPQGCAGNNYLDVLVSVDGQPAGVVPLYPWLNSDLNRYFERSVDVPVPTPQSINLLPHRLDLTPFAALLSNGVPHNIDVQYATPTSQSSGPFSSAQLLLYLDKGASQVTGQVTRNTLAGSGVQVTQVRSNWQLDGDVLRGDVERHYRRQFEIAGYVNTSRGRIDSSVKQDRVLTNVQVVRVDGASGNDRGDDPHTYAQNLDFVSLTNRTSLRQRGSTVLAVDKERFHYPLQIDYEATGGRTQTVSGPRPYLERAVAFVVQGHHKQGGYYRPAGTYGDRVYANFAGGRAFDALTGESTQWQGARSHYFNDTAGSCSRERVTWLRDVLTSHTQGVNCPNGVNRVRGFAQPDGSPQSMEWLR